jgi:hypothetical protein
VSAACNECGSPIIRIERYQRHVAWERTPIPERFGRPEFRLEVDASGHSGGSLEPDLGWFAWRSEGGSPFHLFCANGHESKCVESDLPVELFEVVYAQSAEGRDPLTDLSLGSGPDYRLLRAWLMREVARAREDDRPRALLLLGVDRQGGGHVDQEELVRGLMHLPFLQTLVGERIQRVERSIISERARENMARLSADEAIEFDPDGLPRACHVGNAVFGVMLREYGLEEAAEFYRQVREAIHERPFDYFGAIGISGGAAELVPNEDVDSLIEAASNALDRAWAEGGDRLSS